MTLNKLKMALYSLWLTNYYGFKLSGVTDPLKRKEARIEYSLKLLKKLNLHVKVINQDKVPKDGQYLLASNHRTIIDPLIVEAATCKSNIHGDWIAKKELYNSFFFGKFVRNLGTILLDRESSNKGGFFKDIKESVKSGNSIYIFPEGTRNKTDSAIAEFKEGAQIISVKNRLPILPVFIRSRANEVLKEALNDSSVEREIEIEIGDVIDYKDRELPFAENYKKQFNIQ
ncbi:1-acyl-sn-glycerol-3-phosphate acyltransferase [Sulfurimonas sp.]|nr:1-acyl-sn-glycerol-3-phosphate acyltransferase [Sulfurimonas sp.]